MGKNQGNCGKNFKIMIKTVISDMGNVVLKFDHMIACNNFAKYADNFEPSEIYNFVNKSDIDYSFDTGKISSEKFFEIVSSHLKLKLNFEDFKRIFADIFSLNTTFAGILREFKKKYKLILLSNTNIIHFEFARKKFDIMDIFDDFVLSYELGTRKPEPEIYRRALKISGSEPNECVYIDDIKEFSDTATTLGITEIHYKSDEYLKNRLTELNLFR